VSITSLCLPDDGTSGKRQTCESPFVNIGALQAKSQLEFFKAPLLQRAKLSEIQANLHQAELNLILLRCSG